MSDAAGVEANPTMIALARESRGLTQTSLASAVGVSQPTISQVEAGRQVASQELVARLAAALKVPTSLFYQDYEFRNLPITFYRKRKTAPKKSVDELQARMNLMRFRIHTLLESLEWDSVPIPNAEPGRTRSPAKIAQELRIAWNVRPGPIENLVELIERAGIIVVRLDFKSEKIDGTSMYQRGDRFPPLVFVSAEAPCDRMRWTLAHELGHVVLHSGQPIPDENSERQADEFAAEFLMPERDIRGDLAGSIDLPKLARLKVKWRVSMQALLYRAQKIGHISQHQAKRLWSAMSRLGYRRAEPVDLEPESPGRLNQLLEFHLSERSDSSLMEMMHIEPADYRQGFRRTGRWLYAM